MGDKHDAEKGALFSRDGLLGKSRGEDWKTLVMWFGNLLDQVLETWNAFHVAELKVDSFEHPPGVNSTPGVKGIDEVCSVLNSLATGLKL